MSRFYFDFREDGTFFEDRDGSDCPDLNAAGIEAAKSAALIGRDKLSNIVGAATRRSVTVEVRNEHSQRVLTVTVSIVIERIEPSRSCGEVGSAWA
jgi:hypothetical protein